MHTSDPCRVHVLPVAAGHHGWRLDRFLAHQLEGLSRSRVQRLITEGRASVNGTPCLSARRAVRIGDEVRLEVPPPRPAALEPEPLPLRVVFEDDRILVLDKPPGLVVHPGAGHARGTLVHGLLHHCRDLSGIGGELRPGIVHRLDKDTSGLMVVAKDDDAHARLAAQFAAGDVEKTYLALVKGEPGADRGRMEAAIGRHPVHRKRMAVRRSGGKAAVTEWEVVERLGGAALLRLRLHTGRTHQIRVHMAAAGHPVLGDALYGGGTILRPRGLRLPRQMLHAAALALRHPATGERLEWRAPLPPDMAAALESLRG
ncbi:RluA family pseudouridine synthase [Dissulfurirhabdus thermomarina]|uniref:Pseudouridine synthase n=1 Tax=Dissulfurirhabdus thermomarina TaxID=1765737 RepID=A0A6N9TKS8_DISTH|nr:RluA family pseudouridine synthase [Dissulfurirhabdus thermomarina]NDY41678.1 RluA family pseudouridine synthase [Dissulfurirhabdus thermomarina]NMX22754.1 RluA family pseudouridine synthase [Dissulfurirhabdus thermomarina]